MNLRVLAVVVALAAPVLSAQAPYTLVEIPSSALGSTRSAWVSLPRDYALAARRYPLTIVLDGQDRRLLDLASATARTNLVLDFFDPLMPDQIVVGVESLDRGADFGRNAAAFRRFIESELIPALEARYRVGGRHTIVGHSLAGRFALQEFCAAPERFYGVVAISPALSDTASVRPLIRCIQRLARPGPQDHAMYVARGADRTGDQTEASFAPMIDSLIAALRAAPDGDLRSRATILRGWSHSRTPVLGIPEGLAFVLADARLEVPDSLKRLVLTGRVSAAIVADTFARRVADRVGVAFEPQVRWYQLIGYLTVDADPQGALAMLQRAVTSYPEHFELQLQLADVARRAGDAAGSTRALDRAEALVPQLEGISTEQRARLRAEVTKARAPRPE